MPYQYPNTVYDQPANLLSLLGSFWASAYGGQDQVLGVVQAKCLIENQTMLDVMELLASLSRFTIPLYHKENWYPYYIRSSQLNNATNYLIKYDEGGLYDSGIFYDIPFQKAFAVFPAPANLTNTAAIVNRFTDPTLLWQPNIDYIVTDNTVVFKTNPFEDPRVATRAIYENGQIVDNEAILWLFKGEFDLQYVYQQFGYVLGLQLQTSKGYQDLMNAVWDALVGGTTKQTIYNALSAITGIPLVKETQEVVQNIAVDGYNRLIITDQHVYKFGLNSTPTVTVGQTVYRGEALTDALVVTELNTGVCPDDLVALSMGAGFIASCFFNELVFENRDVPLNVITDDPSNYTKLTWQLGGFPPDVTKFFDELHARGVAAAQAPIPPCYTGKIITYTDRTPTEGLVGTLAQYMDNRPVSVNEPQPSNLPTMINPLQFLIRNVLRNNTYIVTIRAGEASSTSVQLYNTRLLHRIIPPNTAMITLFELTLPPEQITVDQVQENIGTFQAMTPMADTVPVEQINDKPLVKIVHGTYS